MKKLLIIILFYLASGTLTAQVTDIQSLMQQANQHYADNQFNAAIELYEKILQGFYESPELYFNLGNAYFKEGNIPAAILNYEKALKLDPTDGDIRYNLDLANSRIIDKIEPLPEFFLKEWWRSIRDLFSSNQWAKGGLLFLILGLSSAFIFFVSRSVIARKIAFWAGSFCIFLMLLSFIFSSSGYHKYKRNDAGIIFAPTVTVKSSPNDNSVDLFVIHEGTKVFITDRVESWCEIRLVNGNVGWIKNSTFAAF
jgi:tetratricopeptide (TPR) repeat protein